MALSKDGYINATRMCKAADKDFHDFFRSKRTQAFLALLSHQTGRAPADLVQSERGGCHTGTWVHPDVETRLAAWCDNRKRRRHSNRGYVYAVTSDVLNAVKIGMWTGSLQNLRNRYLTPYGPSLQIWCVIVDDCMAAEMQLHKQFESHNIGGELFDKDEMGRYQQALCLMGFVDSIKGSVATTCM